MKFIDCKCPNCGGEIEVQPGATRGKCVNCGADVVVDKEIDNMIIRAFDLISQQDYEKANEIFCKCLEKDAMCGDAYLGLLLCDIYSTGSNRDWTYCFEKDLSSISYDYSEKPNYLRACKYLDQKKKNALMHVCDCNKKYVLEYKNLCQKFEESDKFVNFEGKEFSLSGTIFFGLDLPDPLSEDSINEASVSECTKIKIKDLEELDLIKEKSYKLLEIFKQIEKLSTDYNDKILDNASAYTCLQYCEKKHVDYLLQKRVVIEQNQNNNRSENNDEDESVNESPKESSKKKEEEYNLQIKSKNDRISEIGKQRYKLEYELGSLKTVDIGRKKEVKSQINILNKEEKELREEVEKLEIKIEIENVNLELNKKKTELNRELEMRRIIISAKKGKIKSTSVFDIKTRKQTKEEIRRYNEIVDEIEKDLKKQILAESKKLKLLNSRLK